MTRLSFLLAAWMLPFGVSATKVAQLSVAQLFDAADVVAIVSLESGRALGEGSESCGALYTGRIQRAFKGAAAAEAVEFGHTAGYRIGARYLLFLTKPGKSFDPLASTNSASMAREKQYRDRCESRHKGHRVMHSGVGAIEIERVNVLGNRDGLLVRSEYLAFPASIPRTKPRPGEASSDPAWIAEADVVRYLETLK